ncbi:MAG TPA: transglycosylase domain-containing protein, partial [Balneolales bacterium]|nr:transglycosylase domain-containing protein [Balneolales bacterium]
DISEGHFAEGASGIIQQFSRGIILHDDKKFWRRKEKEVLIGLGLGDRYTHRQLLHFYMSSVFLGSFSHPAVQIRGFQDGAYDLFGKDISKVTQPEGLALVALISRPNLYLKSTPDFREVYQKRAEFLKEKHIISRSDYRNLMQNIPVIDTTMVKTRALDMEYHEQIAEQLKPVAGHSGPVHSTVDLKVTGAARNVLTSAVKSISKETGINDLDGFIVVAHYDSILAMVGSAQRGDRYMNNLEIRSAWRPGSLVKPLIYSEFISQGGDIHQKLPADGPKTFNTPGGGWTVKNYSSQDNTPSMQPAIDALARSNNVAAAYLAVSYGDSLQQRLHKAGVDSTFSPYPATFIGADATKPMNLFRLLQAYVPPYGEIPDHFITEKSDISPYDPLFPYDVARQTAYCLTYALKDPKGTLHFTEDQYDWSSADYLGKTGTAQANTSAGLFVARPNGISVLMGLFSRSGAPLNYRSGGSVQGASLAPYLQRLFEAPSVWSRVKGNFDFKPYENRQPVFVQAVNSFFNKVGSVGKKLWNSLKGGD